ncbi:DEAD/DEAH box helicase [Parascardovia denticolens]
MSTPVTDDVTPSIKTVFDAVEYIKKNAKTEHQKGMLWERVSRWYLRNDPEMQQFIGRVWKATDPDCPIAYKTDTGVDIIAEDTQNEGKYWAIQCKAYDVEHEFTWEELSTFIASVATDSRYTGCMLLSTATNISNQLAENFMRMRKNKGLETHIIGLQTMSESNLDWSNLFTDRKAETQTFDPRPHQIKAINQINAAFEKHDRCKAIMACGTGKTLMSLRLAEERAKGGLILFAAPSIALVSQAMREWTNQARCKMRALVVCSDAKASKQAKDNDDILDSLLDLNYPANTDAQSLLQRYQTIRRKSPDSTVVVFVTYQSMQVIQDAQDLGLPEFDLAICDEAHRTTGIRTVDMRQSDVSAFQIVNDGDRIRASKRLYMTATPKIYGESVKQKAKAAEAVLCDMDDESVYGPVAASISFATAVEQKLLCDYRVVVLAVNEDGIPSSIQQIISNGGELPLDDAAKIIGTYKGLATHGVEAQARLNQLEDSHELTPDFLLINKVELNNDSSAEQETSGIIEGQDIQPLHRAVGFCSTIKESKRMDEVFANVVRHYQEESGDTLKLNCELQHVDGSMNSSERSEKLSWLADGEDENECRILTNARCLAEGVDVPSLDAVIFFAPKKSEVDVVQAVGRAMRTFTDSRTGESKELGYIILPVAIPEGMSPEDALSRSKTFDVVWKVLQGLRSHDERMDAYVNSIPFRTSRPKDQNGRGSHRIGIPNPHENGNQDDGVQGQLALSYGSDELERAVYAKAVEKCGTRIYWDEWADDVAGIAQRHIERIQTALDGDWQVHEDFAAFVKGLRNTLNPGITEKDAVEMIAQHIVTLPVFDALFGDYAFAKSNPVSIAIENFLATLKVHGVTGLDASSEPALQDLYDSVRRRAQVARTDSNRQELIKDLYNDFFSKAFKATSQKLGIVYTPMQIVDYMLHATDRVLKRGFGCGLADEGVHILDPFAGTGSYMAELISDPDLIPVDKLEHKYKHELHSNEILLLAYYIMVINIEYAYHARTDGAYEPFTGAVLTDTFQMSEDEDTLDDRMFIGNSERVTEQLRSPIHVIIGNPPYSAGQKSANDNNANEHYPHLENRIRETYSDSVKTVNKNSLMDSYIEAFRWASDRIEGEGIVCFVSNAGWLRSEAGAGVRRCFVEEFNNIYIFDLLGNARLSGEARRKENGNVFGVGTRTPIAITLLVKKPRSSEHGEIHYFSVGEYKTQEQKLASLVSFREHDPEWELLSPDENGNWLDHGDEHFDKLIPMGVMRKGKKISSGLFNAVWSRGIATAKDPWVWEYDSKAVAENCKRLINNMNNEIKRVSGHPELVEYDATKFTWNRETLKFVKKGQPFSYNEDSIIKGQYRPFIKQWLYSNSDLMDMVYLMPKLFPLIAPHQTARNIVINTGERGTIIADILPDLELNHHGQCFPLYWYEKVESVQLIPSNEVKIKDAWGNVYIRHDGITDRTLRIFREAYKTAYPEENRGADSRVISKEDIFYYIYGILHSPIYREKYKFNLLRDLPRMPFVRQFKRFSEAGRSLAKLHLAYEEAEPWPGLEYSALPIDLGRVEKLRWSKKDDYTKLIYNSRMTISNIPEEANTYKVNGKSPLEWMMRFYQVSQDKASGIINDPNEYSDDPLYIFNLIGKLVTVSMRTNEIVAGLPNISEIEKPIDWPREWEE